MTDESPTGVESGRRTFLKTVAAAGAASAVSSVAAGAEANPKIDDSVTVVDSPDSGLSQEVFVTFTDRAECESVAEVGPDWYHVYSNFPVVWTEMTGREILEVAGWDSVLRVTGETQIELENHDSQEHTNAREVWEDGDLGYRGENVNVAIIDSGIDGTHPGMGNVEANYRYVGEPRQDPPEMWVDAGSANIDELGHGTHCTGSICGTGDGGLQEDYTGMAPEANITSYEVFDEVYIGTAYAAGYASIVAGDDAYMLVVGTAQILGAYDHILEQHRSGEREFQIVSNSWGSGPGDFDPYGPVNMAIWEAYTEGILTVFSAGNDGDGEDTLGQRKKAPFVLDVAAAHPDKSIADFSSRGTYDGNHNRKRALTHFQNMDYQPEVDPGELEDIQLERPSVVAKGEYVVSAQSPDSIMNALFTPIYAAEGRNEATDEPLYCPARGTSMSCPTTAGVVALFLDAYYDEHGEFPDPIDTINTIEATAREDLHPDPTEARSSTSQRYTTANAGAGYVDARAAVERAVEGKLASWGEVTLAPDEPIPGTEAWRDERR